MDQYVQISEEKFRELVLEEHKKGHFRGDPHKMQANFKLSPKLEEFVAVVNYDEDKVVSFCGLELYRNAKNVLVGRIHCLGVPQEYRRNGWSLKALIEVENVARNKYSEVFDIYSTCNPISGAVHEKLGYDKIAEGRVTSTGKISQIRYMKAGKNA